MTPDWGRDEMPSWHHFDFNDTKFLSMPVGHYFLTGFAWHHFKNSVLCPLGITFEMPVGHLNKTGLEIPLYGMLPSLFDRLCLKQAICLLPGSDPRLG